MTISFGDYATVLTSTGWVPSRRLDALPGPPPLSLRMARTLVPARTRDGIKRTLTRALALEARRRAAGLVASGQELRLHLGCGPNHLSGWINVDLVSARPDLPWDLARPTPFPDSSITAIFYEHLLEHLPLPPAIGLLRESHRLLKPGGVLRVGVPDFGRYARDYAGRRTLIARLRPGRPTALLALSELAFCFGHASVWDDETLLAALREAGFPAPAVRRFGDSAIDPAPDSPWREDETLYAEAMRS